MSASCSLFKTHCSASGVEHSTTGNFTSPTDVNLIIAKNNILEIYKLPPQSSDSTKLIFIARFRLFGEIQCVQTARFVPNHYHSLLIAFPDAKLSVIDFDAAQRTIVTRALFNLDTLFRRIGNVTATHTLKLHVDPLQRCAALLLSADLLFILPLFTAYLERHRAKRGSAPIHAVYKETLGNEQQLEVEDAENRKQHNSGGNNSSTKRSSQRGRGRGGGRGGRSFSRNRRRGGSPHMYVSPLPPPHKAIVDGKGDGDGDDDNDKEGSTEMDGDDVEYLQAMRGDKEVEDKDESWDAVYRTHTYYRYKSLLHRDYFIIDLRAKCEKILDFVFLDGYNTPQILLLFERSSTWGGRIAVRDKTVSLLSITVNVVRRAYNIPFILCDILTHDFSQLYAIPSTSNMLYSAVILEQINAAAAGSNNAKKNYPRTPAAAAAAAVNTQTMGGAFLIGVNAILHFGQTIDFGLSLNEHGDVLRHDFPLVRKWTERVINLERAVMAAVPLPVHLAPNVNANSTHKNYTDFLLSDGDGFMYVVSIGAGKLSMCTVGLSAVASTMSNFADPHGSRQFIFVGSRLGDSLLLRHRFRKQQPQPQLQPQKQVVTSEVPKPKQKSEYDQLFGGADSGAVTSKQEMDEEATTTTTTTTRKRTFSEIDDAKASAKAGDLAMDLFGVTAETLAAAAENNATATADPTAQSDDDVSVTVNAKVSQQQQSVPSPTVSQLRHHSLYGPKVKRRKLSASSEMPIYEFAFLQLADFKDENLLEHEIEKETNARVQNAVFADDAQRTPQDDEAVDQEHSRVEQRLREKYEFKVDDTLHNLSPITSVAMTRSHDARFLHSEYANMMASTGFGTQSKLSIVQEGVRPQILARTNTARIIDGIACWTLYDDVASSEPPEQQPRYHSYLVATDLHHTQVIDLRDKITPLQTSGFRLDCRTILCAQIGGGGSGAHAAMYTVQIHTSGVRLLQSMKCVHEFQVATTMSGSSVTVEDGYVCDPHVLLFLSDHSLRVLTFEEDKSDKFTEHTPELPRYKAIDIAEEDRRKREFVARRGNRMTWPQYLTLEACINKFLSAQSSTRDSNMEDLVKFIQDTLINEDDDDGDETAKTDAGVDVKETEAVKLNGKSSKEEASDDDDDDDDEDIKLSDELQQKVGIENGAPSAHHMDAHLKFTNKKSLFDLNVSVAILLKRLYGVAMNGSFTPSPEALLQAMIRTDLDLGAIESVYLFQMSDDTLCSKPLRQLHQEWRRSKEALTMHNAICYQQLLSSSFQTKRHDFILQAQRQKFYRKRGAKNNHADGKLDTEQQLMTQIYFGDAQDTTTTTAMDVDDADTDDGDAASNPTATATSTTYMIVARSRGVLQIYQLPEFVLVFECSEVHIGHDLLVNRLIHDETLQMIMSKHQLNKRKNLKQFIAEERQQKMDNRETYFDDELIPNSLKDELWCPSTGGGGGGGHGANVHDNADEQSYERRKVSELYVHTLHGHPYLLVFLDNGDLLSYEMFEFFVGQHHLLSKIGRNLNNDDALQNMEILPVRFKRFSHDLFTPYKYTTAFNIQSRAIHETKKRVYPFADINGLKGVVVGGNHPAVILSHRGTPIVHNFAVKHDIRGFAVLNHPQISNVAQDDKVRNGCVYFTQYGLVIATIPTSVHNIAFNTSVFTELDANADSGATAVMTETEKQNGDDQKETEKTDKQTDKTDAAAENSDDDDKDEKEDTDPTEERFGHCFVLQKERLNNCVDYLDIDYDAEYPVAHIPLSETLHFMVEHEQSGTFLLVMSRYKYIAGTEMPKPRDIRPMETYFECRLFNPYKWRFDDRLSDFTIHQKTEESLPISEHILCAKSVTVQETSKIGSQTVVNKNLIVLGTGTNQGEDMASIGRIVLLEVIAEKEVEKLNTSIRDDNERFYHRTRKNQQMLLAEESMDVSLEGDALYEVYANANAVQREYYGHELAYYKKCRQQDKTCNIRYRMHFVFARRERAAITAINCINGLIVAAIGPKLLLFRWDGTQLVGTAFLDTRIHCHSILVLKNFLLTADIFQGLDLYHWEQEIASTIRLARDVQYRSVYSVHWNVHRTPDAAAVTASAVNEFEILVSDMNQNLQVLSYRPQLNYGFLSRMDKEKLYTKCMFHIATNISDSVTMRFRNGSNYFKVGACIDGSVHYLVPISEQIYGRLSSLQSQLIFYCQHFCGLNPREFRYCMNNYVAAKDTIRHSHIMHNHSVLSAIHGMDRPSTVTSKNIIDHDLIEQFMSLDYRTQNKLTTNIGVRNSNVIISHLSQICSNTKWF